MKCPLTSDCSRAGAVPATQRTSSDPALFSAPDPTHYREYIYYHMTTPYQPKSGSPRFRAKCARPLFNFEGGVWERDYIAEGGIIRIVSISS